MSQDHNAAADALRAAARVRATRSIIAAINPYLPTDLAAIVHAYFRPSGYATIYALALHGNWEEVSASSYHDDALRGACEGGYLDLARHVITLGAVDWGRGIWAACVGDHIDIANFIIDHVARVNGIIPRDGRYSWNACLNEACDLDRPDFARLAIEHGADNWEDALYRACKSGSMVCSELVIAGVRPVAPTPPAADPVKRGRGRPRRATYVPPPPPTAATDWNCGMRGACAGNQPTMARLMIARGATYCSCGRSLAAHLS